ncbi:hypothetical protein PCANC_06600 [Puccinia coronata f. sp. avenae]|uniref:Uncharacterized protein n=1 Tax=Puccinia coronata f. sp. avenae TaxID=200324 RepID=A0A2N5VA67_9BASI|nr:hypothetical protein PCANC_06600 [Puccinia coronata f. sp. avenae]
MYHESFFRKLLFNSTPLCFLISLESAQVRRQTLVHRGCFELGKKLLGCFATQRTQWKGFPRTRVCIPPDCAFRWLIPAATGPGPLGRADRTERFGLRADSLTRDWNCFTSMIHPPTTTETVDNS